MFDIVVEFLKDIIPIIPLYLSLTLAMNLAHYSIFGD